MPHPALFRSVSGLLGKQETEVNKIRVVVFCCSCRTQETRSHPVPGWCWGTQEARGQQKLVFSFLFGCLCPKTKSMNEVVRGCHRLLLPRPRTKNMRLNKVRFFWLFVPENSRVILIYWFTLPPLLVLTWLLWNWCPGDRASCRPIEWFEGGVDRSITQ